MKKHLFGIAVLLVTFSLGAGAVRLINTDGISTATAPNLERRDQPKLLYPTDPNEKIAVYFRGFVVNDQDGPTAKFEIVNHNDRSAFYYGYLTGEGEQTSQTVPFVKVNGKEQEQFVCGNGLQTFELKPGESIFFTAHAGFLSYYLEKERDLQIGFDLSFGSDKNYRKYWSDTLQIPKPIHSQLLQKAKELK